MPEGLPGGGGGSWNFDLTDALPVSSSLYQFQAATVGHSDEPGFMTKWNNFLPVGNSTFAPTEISGFFS